jgi:hypothetical protein
MAAAALTPRVRIMAICDGVRESKTEVGVFHLKGVRQAITSQAFPFVPARLWLFVVLSSPRAGEFPGYVCVVNDKTDRVVFQGNLTPRPSFGGDGGLWAIYYPVRCRFPGEGIYSVQVWFFQEQGSDVLKGEIPFAVMTEDFER